MDGDESQPISSRVEGINVPEMIRCVDCLGDCHRITFRPEDDPFVPGDVVAYRCRDCLDRWDIILDPSDL